jgi:hypothetical protein
MSDSLYQVRSNPSSFRFGSAEFETNCFELLKANQQKFISMNIYGCFMTLPTNSYFCFDSSQRSMFRDGYESRFHYTRNLDVVQRSEIQMHHRERFQASTFLFRFLSSQQQTSLNKETLLQTVYGQLA